MRHFKPPACLAILLLSFFSIPAGRSQEPAKSASKFQPERLTEDTPIEILYSDQAVQTATRSVQHIRQVTDNVTVITREELDRWPVGDLDEALGLITGIVVQDDGHIGQTATAQMYGSKDNHVRVMIDGITFNATTTGGRADLSQIPLDIVEKIEIIKGASSSVWGSSLGGVINIVTRPAGQKSIPKVNGSMSFGEFRTQRKRGEVSGKAGPLGYYAFGSYVDSGGFRPHSDVLEKRALLKAELPVEEWIKLKGCFGYSGSKVSEFDLPRGGLSFDRQVLSRYGSGGLDFKLGDQVKVDSAYKISERSFRRTTRLFPSFANFRLSGARSLIHEISAQGVWDVDDYQTFVFGSDIGVDVYQDAQLQTGSVRFTVNKNNTRHAYYSNYQLSLWRFDATTGGRLDVTNGYGTNFDPSAGVVLHLPVWNALLRGNVSRAFNAPSLVDRYLSVGTTAANPDLKAEHAIVYNLGFEAELIEKVKGKAVFFQTFLEDSIQTIRRTDGLRQAVNINKERRTGFETEVKLGPWLGFSPSYGTAFVYASDQNGVPLQNRPRLTHDVKLNFMQSLLGFVFNAHIAGRHTDLVTYADSGFTDPIDQLFIFEGRAILTLPEVKPVKISLFLDGGNLLNQDFGFDGSNDPAPQRHFEAGFKISFDP